MARPRRARGPGASALAATVLLALAAAALPRAAAQPCYVSDADPSVCYAPFQPFRTNVTKHPTSSCSQLASSGGHCKAFVGPNVPVLIFEVSSVAVAAGAPEVVYVTSNHALVETYTVDYVAVGTAGAPGAAAAPASGTLTFSRGAAGAAIAVPAPPRGAGGYTIALTNPVGAALGEFIELTVTAQLLSGPQPPPGRTGAPHRRGPGGVPVSKYSRVGGRVHVASGEDARPLPADTRRRRLAL